MIICWEINFEKTALPSTAVVISVLKPVQYEDLQSPSYVKYSR